MHDPRRLMKSRLEHEVARALLALPPALLRRMAGAPVVKDGLTLHPEMQALMALRRLRRAPDLSEGTPEEARRRFRRDSLLHAGRRVEVRAVRDLVIDKDPPLRARHYAPEQRSEPQPLVVFLHGGGFVVGDLDTHDPFCRLLCRHARVHVLSVDYRLAPDAPFPAAVDDARAAVGWAFEHAEELGADRERIAVGGDSAGGNLSAVVAKCADELDVSLRAQMLLYPAIDRSVEWPSLALFAEGFLLTRADIERFERWYVGDRAHKAPRGHAPLRHGSLAGLAPALVVTAGFDPLRDEGEAYAEALVAAGTPVVLRRFDSLPHGFVNLLGLSAACRAAGVEVARSLRDLLDADAAGVQAMTSTSPPRARAGHEGETA